MHYHLIGNLGYLFYALACSVLTLRGIDCPNLPFDILTFSLGGLSAHQLPSKPRCRQRLYLWIKHLVFVFCPQYPGTFRQGIGGSAHNKEGENNNGYPVFHFTLLFGRILTSAAPSVPRIRPNNPISAM